MKILTNIPILLALLWLTGCTSGKFAVNSDYDRQANFKKYTTYKIEPLKAEQKEDPVLNSTLNQKRIKDALNIEMNARGYEAVNESPDLYVRYQTDKHNKQEVQNNNTWPYPYSWRMPNNTSIRNVEETRLIVSLIDAETDQMVWQGWASGELSKSKKDREAVFREIVYEIMKEYRYRAGGQKYDLTSRR